MYEPELQLKRHHTMRCFPSIAINKTREVLETSLISLAIWTLRESIVI